MLPKEFGKCFCFCEPTDEGILIPTIRQSLERELVEVRWVPDSSSISKTELRVVIWLINSYCEASPGKPSGSSRTSMSFAALNLKKALSSFFETSCTSTQRFIFLRFGCARCTRGECGLAGNNSWTFVLKVSLGASCVHCSRETLVNKSHGRAPHPCF